MDMSELHRGQRRTDARLKPSALDGWVFGAVFLSLLGGRALYCGSLPGSMQACMRDGMHGVLGLTLHAGALLLAIWAGSRLGRWLKRDWLGLVLGVGIFGGLASLLVWLGFPT